MLVPPCFRWPSGAKSKPASKSLTIVFTPLGQQGPGISAQGFGHSGLSPLVVVAGREHAESGAAQDGASNGFFI